MSESVVVSEIATVGENIHSDFRFENEIGAFK